MNKNCFFIPVFFISSVFNTQVGINTNSPRGILDIVSSNSGVVLPSPKIPINNTNVPSPAVGTMLYDSANKSIRYFDGVNWNTLKSSQTDVVPYNEGVVKLNKGQVKGGAFPTVLGVTDADTNPINQGKPYFPITNGELNTYYQVIYTCSNSNNASLSFSGFPTTSWPENSTSDIIKFYNCNTNFFQENFVLGQVHLWRIILNYRGKNDGSVINVTTRLWNPDVNSTFLLEQTAVAPNKTITGKLQFYFVSIADVLSINANNTLGYRIGVKSDGPITLTVDSVTRVSLAKD